MQIIKPLVTLVISFTYFLSNPVTGQDLTYADYVKGCKKGIAMACVPLGYAEDKKGNDEAAYKAFKRGCSLGEKLACFLTGTKEHKRGNLKEAFKLHTMACDKGEERSCADLGVLYSQTGNQKAAKSNYEKACDKDYMPSCLMLAYMEDESGNQKRAIEILKKVCPTDDRACAYQGNLELQIGSKENAYNLLSRTCSKNIGMGCSGLGLLKMQNGDKTEAEGLFKKACQLGVKEACEVDVKASEVDDNSLNLPPDGESSVCNLGTIGGTSRAAFNEFDKGLKNAAASGKPQSFSKFLEFPIRWNVNERSKTISNAAEFKLVAEMIFNPQTRQTIIDQKGFFCRDLGLMYGNGTIWVDVKKVNGRDHYFIKSVSSGVLDKSSTPSIKAPEIKLKCKTDKHFITVEDIGNNVLRYKGWSVGKSLSSKPDLTLNNGTYKVEGTGVCAYRIYTFKNGQYAYQPQELGCTEGSEPEGTIGRLIVTNGAKELGNWHCKAVP